MQLVLLAFFLLHGVHLAPSPLVSICGHNNGVVRLICWAGWGGGYKSTFKTTHGSHTHTILSRTYARCFGAPITLMFCFAFFGTVVVRQRRLRPGSKGVNPAFCAGRAKCRVPAAAAGGCGDGRRSRRRCGGRLRPGSAPAPPRLRPGSALGKLLGNPWDSL